MIDNMYYQTNAIYKFFENHPDGRFFFVSSNMWMLVYGDNDCDPLLLALVSGVTEEQKYTGIMEHEEIALNTLSELSIRSAVPLTFIRFVMSTRSIDSVAIYDMKAKNFINQSLERLKRLFSKYGLPVSNSPTAKYLNDKASSAYHNWQREQLGRSLKVSDIDLVHIKDGNIRAVYELKRSFIKLEDWQPYQDDYPNFVLLSKLMQKADLRLFIAYNNRTKNPWNDDISRIKLFEFKHYNSNPVKCIGIYSFNDFLKL